MGLPKLESWVRLMDGCSRLLTRLAVLLAVLLLIVAVGNHLGFNALERWSEPEARPQPSPPVVDWSEVDVAVAESLHEARSVALRQASADIHGWSEAVVERADGEFLDWYFDYWNQQALGIQGLVYWTSHRFAGGASAEERLLADITDSFSTRALRPAIAQMELDHIAEAMVSTYTQSLNENLAAVRHEYAIPRADWERYLRDMSLLAASAEANRGTPLEVKFATGGVLAGGLYLSSRMGLAVHSIRTMLGQRLTTGATGPMVSGTAAKASSRVSGRALGTAAAVGLVAWDLWDHRQTAERERPILRQAIADYVGEVEHDLLHDPVYGLATLIDQFEADTLQALEEHRTLETPLLSSAY